MLCPWCRRFEELSEKIMSKQVLSVSCESSKEAVPLPCMEGTAYLCFTDEESVRRVLKQTDSIVRVYTINQICTGLRYSSRLFVGNYAASNRMDVLASQARGISRIGICRMDVDDLGQAFISGFEHPEQSEADKRFHYVTLSRTSAFSRQMSLFFRFYINAVLSGDYQNKLPLQTAIVYSGGDDVFLVGAWDDVIEAAQRIREAFCAYTCGTLTISCGIGMFMIIIRFEWRHIRQKSWRTLQKRIREKMQSRYLIQVQSISMIGKRSKREFWQRSFRRWKRFL